MPGIQENPDVTSGFSWIIPAFQPSCATLHAPRFSSCLSPYAYRRPPTSCLPLDPPRILVTPMTAALAHIVEEIEALTPREKIELRRRIVERIPWAEDLNEDDYSALSAASFTALDEEEDRGA